ncbi:MAG: DUF4340 domain-containing protein [Acidobacteria bacterium]|nr:MAG: DUF4340 domain-containing protein [Acidobacteriota bacterium]
MHPNLVKWNKILFTLAAALVLLSFYTWNDSVRRAERFERGQKLLPNLNPDEIAEIQVAKGEESAHLRRTDDGFVVVNADGYPAANEAVNRLLRDLLDLSLEKEVGRDQELRQELGLVPGEGEAVEVVLKDRAGKEMVRFVLGKAFEGGSGNYVERTDDEGSEIYLTSERVYLSTAAADFVKKDILDVPESKIAAIRGKDFEISRQDGVLTLAGVPAGKKEIPAKMSQLKGILTGLRFTAHHLADAPEVAGLIFTDRLEVQLEDGSGYHLAVADKGEKHFLKIAGYPPAEQVEVALDASEEEVRETSEVLVRADEINEFNDFHGSWVYEVSDFVANKIKLKKADLLQDA